MTTLPDGAPLPQNDMAANWYPGQIAAGDHGARQPPAQQPQPAASQSNTPPAAGSSEPLADFPADVARASEFYVLPDAAAMLPEGVTLPEGTTLTPNKQILDAVLPVLHKHRISRESFQDIARIFNAHEVRDFNNGRASSPKQTKNLVQVPRRSARSSPPPCAPAAQISQMSLPPSRPPTSSPGCDLYWPAPRRARRRSAIAGMGIGDDDQRGHQLFEHLGDADGVRASRRALCRHGEGDLGRRFGDAPASSARRHDLRHLPDGVLCGRF